METPTYLNTAIDIALYDDRQFRVATVPFVLFWPRVCVIIVPDQ